MKIKCIICIVFLVFSMAAGGTIQAQNEAAGYVISVEGEKVYIDLAVGKVKPGDKVAVYSKEGYFIHPVTKKRLKREPSQVASLEVVKVYTDYSLAKAVPAQSLSKVEVGMSVQCNAMSQSSHSESSGDVYGPPAAKENRSSQDDRRKGLGICGSGTGERCGRCGVFRNVCVRFVDGAIDVLRQGSATRPYGDGNANGRDRFDRELHRS